MRALFLLLCAGCVDRDLCADYDGACVGLRVQGSGNVDQLQVAVTGALRLDGRTPGTPGTARPLPVTTAVFLPAAVGGAIDLTVTGWLGGEAVGRGVITAVVRPNEHQNVDVRLTPILVTDMAPDLTLRDLAVGDLAVGDLAVGDLALSDFAVEDLALPDLRNKADLIGTNWRYVFLLTARGPVLGNITSLDIACRAEAIDAGLPDVPYGALLAYPSGVAPANHIVLGQGRDIVKPTGVKVSTDDDFFSATINHLSAIDQLANGTTVAAGCAYSNFSRTGVRINNANGDCSGWTVDTNATSGTSGDVKDVDMHWAFKSIDTCNTLSCHIYCIQQ